MAKVTEVKVVNVVTNHDLLEEALASVGHIRLHPTGKSGAKAMAWLEGVTELRDYDKVKLRITARSVVVRCYKDSVLREVINILPHTPDS